jgi:dihydroxyacetone kinase-like protein
VSPVGTVDETVDKTDNENQKQRYKFRESMLFTKTLLQEMLQAALAVIENNAAMLNQLDAATGDGDHGTAIVTAMKTAAASAQKEGALKTTLETIGWDIMSSTSGSTSTLTGSFFIGMASAVTGEELDGVQTIAMFESGLANIRTSSRANVGDKTLMDALIPAIESMSALKGQSPSLADIFATAAETAQRGADSTKDLVAKFGRAKNLGERSRGTLDAGAVSTALIYRAYAETISTFASSQK